MKVNKAVSWFSCGAASAVTSKLALKKYGDDVDIVYCDTGSEHESNMQFLHDCEKWFDREIIIMKNEKYDDVLDVLLNGRNDTVCHGITRIVGYYSRITNWNASKVGEQRDRIPGREHGAYGFNGTGVDTQAYSDALATMDNM